MLPTEEPWDSLLGYRQRASVADGWTVANGMRCERRPGTVSNGGSVANGRAVANRRKASIDRWERWVLGKSMGYRGHDGGGEICGRQGGVGYRSGLSVDSARCLYGRKLSVRREADL